MPQFKARLIERLEAPRVPSAQLRGHSDRYKIELKSAGHRLAYEARDEQVAVIVIAVGKRERDAVDLAAAKRQVSAGATSWRRRRAPRGR